MRSTFMGLETSRSGLFTQQSALYTTGHNISNTNTLGYSRQRVNMQATPGFPTAGLNTPYFPGHMGTGVEAHSVQRIRDEFVDRQFRQETNKLGYWQSTTKSISQMEDIMSEPSEFGINQAFTEFWKSMEDVIADPKDTAARQVMISKGQSLAESFNYMDTQLKLIQGNIGNEINVVTGEANSLLKQIADLNRQIQSIEPNGYMPNDLYDARDILLDRLNEIIPVSISYEKSGGNALAIAEGSMTVIFRPTNGSAAIELVKGKDYTTLQTLDTADQAINGEVDEPNTNGYFGFKEISVVGIDGTTSPINYNQLEPSKGKLLSLIDAYGHSNGKGIYPEMLTQLDLLANEFATVFNTQHKLGADLNGDMGEDFFVINNTTSTAITARNISVGIKEPKKLAVSDTPGEESNNKNMLTLSALQSAVQGNLQGGTFQTFYKSLIGDLGVKGQQAKTLEFNTTTIHLQIENNRAAHNSVSLDEEMTNMITFQQAYNANARMITLIDETLDKIINGMGRVGL